MLAVVASATGYIGGSVASRLLETGHQVLRLVRNEESSARLRERGIEPLLRTIEHGSYRHHA
jgi:uncharacterized protein YbjT (DUF2867 family)